MVSSFKKDKSKIDLLTDFDMLLMVKKVLEEEICHSVYRYAKANNTYKKDFDKNSDHHIFNTGA